MLSETFKLAVLPQHDPRSRVSIGCLNGWDLRQYDAEDSRLRDFANRGLLHLQVVHERRGISILSSTLRTCGRWEVWAPAEGRFALRNFESVNLCLLYLGYGPINSQA